MKKYIFAVPALLSLFAACTQKNDTLVEDPIVFSATVGEYVPAFGTPSSMPELDDNMVVGVFVGATREMLYHTEQGRLVTDEADIPQSYGQDAYAVIPATKDAATFVDASINVPAEQTFADGKNQSLINSFAYSTVTDGRAEFRFDPLTAVIEFGFTSEDGSKISSMVVSAPSLSDNTSLSGKMGFDYKDGGGFTVDNAVENGSNTIRVSFPEPVALSSVPVYVPVAVLPFSTSGGGLSVTLYNENGYPYEMSPVLVSDDEYCNNGALDVLAADYVSVMAGNVSSGDFTLPSMVEFSIKVNATGDLMPNRSVNIYSVLGNTETFVRAESVGESGKVTFELIPGDYKAYLANEDGLDDRLRSVSFKVISEQTVSVELVYYSYNIEVFHDDFKWITPEMGEGDKELDYFVVTIDPPVVHTGKQNNSKIDVADSGAEEKIAEIGWDFWQPKANGTGQETWVYLRLGEIQMGRSTGYAQATTPAMSSLTEESDVLLSIVADPFYNISKTGVVTAQPTQLLITILGPGSFSTTDASVKEYITAPIESGDLSNPQEVPEGEPVTFGQKTYYDLLVYGATNETKFQLRTYDQNVPDPTSYSQRQILIDDVKVLLGE